MMGEMTFRSSPNQGARPKGATVDLVVLHGTAGTDAGDVAWCCDPASQVSYHFIVLRTGGIVQLVNERSRAWHAGVSAWKGRQGCNDFSVGVAFSNRGPGPPPEPYTDAQYKAGAWLVADILRRHGLGLDAIATHAEVSPGRKTDPWEHFDIERFMRGVAGHLFPPAAGDPCPTCGQIVPPPPLRAA